MRLPDATYGLGQTSPGKSVDGRTQHLAISRIDLFGPREVAVFRHELRAALRADVPASYERELPAIGGHELRVGCMAGAKDSDAVAAAEVATTPESASEPP
jgi:hypothetical protein